MAAKKKSVFYHTRWNKVGLNHERAAEVLGVSVEQVEAWDIEGAPEMAIRARLKNVYRRHIRRHTAFFKFS